MKTIYKPHETPFKILGKQKINYDSEYRLLNYCLLNKIEGDFVLYNTMTKSAVILEKSEIEGIKSLPSHIDDTLKQLVEEWYIVPVNHDDLSLCNQLYDTFEILDNNNRITNYTIFTTTDCNARCFYCFEHSLKKENKTSKTAIDTADFIIKNANGSPINIKWFGGEPLFNEESIDLICKILNKNHIQFVSSMISNGYLFNEETIKKAKEKWHLKKVQITLDGTEEIYNKTKAYIYKDIQSPFITVTDNIEKLANCGIYVRIRLNLTKENRENLYTLIDWISDRYAQKDNISMYCAPVWKPNEERLEKNWAGPMNEKNKMNSLIYQKGFKNVNLITSNISRGCKAQSQNSVVIMPNGDLAKCDVLTKNRIHGNIYDENIDQKVIDFWMHRNILEQCKTCIAYPNCAAYDSCPNFMRRCESVTKQYHQDRISQNMRLIYDDYINNKDEPI